MTETQAQKQASKMSRETGKALQSDPHRQQQLPSGCDWQSRARHERQALSYYRRSPPHGAGCFQNVFIPFHGARFHSRAFLP